MAATETAGRGTRWSRARRGLVAVGIVVAVVTTVAVAVGPGTRRTFIRALSGHPGAALVERCPWLASGVTVDRRVTDLLGHLDLADKLQMLHLLGSGPTAFYEGYTASIPSECVPAIAEQDGSQGVASGFSDRANVRRAFYGSTELPAPVADAAAFDAGLARSYGQVIGREAAAKGVDVALAPTINIVRSPRWGRAYESLGEDPYLTGALAAAEVDGIQSERVAAVVKHFAAYNQETHRSSTLDDAVVSTRALHELYLPAFRTVVEQARPGGIMCGLNLVNGTPACENGPLISGVLRGQWHFGGFVRSDCGAVYSTAGAVLAGVSQTRCTTAFRPDRVLAAIARGEITVGQVDAVLRPLLGVLFRFGLIAAPHAFHPGPASTSADRAVALRVAEEGTVLLRDQRGVLPLRAGATVAVIGPQPSGPSSSGGGALFVRSVPQVGAFAVLRGMLGRRVTTDNGTDIATAVSAARRARVAVVIVGDHDREGTDRSSLSLGATQDALVRAVTAANPRTVVVVESGSAVLMPWLDRTAAVVETWYHGQLGGAALADVLTGRFDPSGKLPVTFPRTDHQGPATTPATFGGVGGVVAYREGLDVGYRWYGAHRSTPLFPFGYGLSYTRFRFSGLHVRAAAGGGLDVTATIRNVGAVRGADVVQCYLGDPAATGEAPRQLRGFARVDLRAGQAARVRLVVTPGDLATWSGPAGWAVTAGRYRVEVGDGSAPSLLPLRATVGVPGATLGVDAGPAPGPAPVVTVSRPA